MHPVVERCEMRVRLLLLVCDLLEPRVDHLGQPADRREQHGVQDDPEVLSDPL